MSVGEKQKEKQRREQGEITLPPAAPSGPFQRFSRFNRDASAWIAISDVALWATALRASGLPNTYGPPDGGRTVSCWSCGCSSGEEAYYIAMIWERVLKPIFPEADLEIIGTDLSAEKIEMAQKGAYPTHSVKTLLADWVDEFFERPVMPAPSRPTRAASRLQAAKKWSTSLYVQVDGVGEDALWQMKDVGIKDKTTFLQQDVTEEMPTGPFDIILSRYAVCLYLEGDKKIEVLTAMVERLRPGGFLVIGEKDHLPPDFCEQNGLQWVQYRVASCLYGPSEILPCVFQKTNEVRFKSPSHEDPRAAAASYSAYQEARGLDPYWTAARKRVEKERVEFKMTDKSRRVLDVAVQEGRRTILDDVVTRCMQNRQEHDAWVREQLANRAAAEASFQKVQTLSSEEKGARLQNFLSCLEQDLEARKRNARKAEKERERLWLPPRSSSRASSQPSKGFKATAKQTTQSAGSLPRKKKKKTAAVPRPLSTH